MSVGRLIIFSEASKKASSSTTASIYFIYPLDIDLNFSMKCSNVLVLRYWAMALKIIPEISFRLL